MRQEAALSLYKKLLQYSRTLALTDQDFFRSRVRALYKASSKLSEKQLEEYIEKGWKIIEQRRIR